MGSNSLSTRKPSILRCLPSFLESPDLKVAMSLSERPARLASVSSRSKLSRRAGFIPIFMVKAISLFADADRCDFFFFAVGFVVGLRGGILLSFRLSSFVQSRQTEKPDIGLPHTHTKIDKAIVFRQ